MGGRGGSGGFRENSLKNMTRNQLADKATELSTENRGLFKKFFKKPKDEFQKERALYQKNSKKIEEIRKEINERDRKSKINAYAETDPTLAHKRTTTTYDRARKRRMKNFDAWFWGK